MRRALVLVAFLAASPLPAQQSRIASDFEIAQMRKQIAGSPSFLAQISGHLNLGDLYLTRSETATARAEYSTALEVASSERLRGRDASDITRYATATSYQALALAKLGRGAEAFAMLEESMRYSADSAKSWNLYASCMTLLGRTTKAVSAARNAVTIAAADLDRAPSLANRLDLAVYQYSLASALIAGGSAPEAERLLRDITSSLRAKEFEPLRRDVAQRESFEIYSSARGDASAYLSLANRAGLRLASLLEQRGDAAAARSEYQRVLEMRTDDVTALTAMARLTPSPAERERYFQAAFDANPFSMPLVRAYQNDLAGRGSAVAEPDDSTAGGKMRGALIDMSRGESRAARTALDGLLASYPGNETLKTLRGEAEGGGARPAFLSSPAPAAPIVAPELSLRQLIALFASDKLAPEERSRLDAQLFVDEVVFDSSTASAAPGQSVFESGSIGNVRLRFAEPTAFTGSFAAGTPLRLTFRILGATESNGADALLVEPVKLEAAR